MGWICHTNKDYELGNKMSRIEVKKPLIVKNVFSDEEHKKLKNIMQNWPIEPEYDSLLGRHLVQSSIIDEYAEKLIPLAKKMFNSENIKTSYSLFAHYQGPGANLYRHKDNNACTYTIDLCLYQTEPWAIGISHNDEDKEYILQENEAVLYYGNYQEHWRPRFPNPESQHVGMVFFHFVESDHWYHTKGPDFLDVIRKKLTKDEPI
jgi:hypothetical protein